MNYCIALVSVGNALLFPVNWTIWQVRVQMVVFLIKRSFEDTIFC